jgi:hypothetical protein
MPGLTSFATKDTPGVDKAFLVYLDTDGRLTPVHRLDASQHQAVLDALAGLARTAPLIVNCSGVIAAGGVAEDFRTADGDSQFLFLANPRSATESLWFCDAVDGNGQPIDADADDGVSVELAPGESYTWPRGVSNAVSIFAATTGHRFIGRKG